jgi:hypothetical protein
MTYKSIRNSLPVSDKVLVLQGVKDKTVAWKYNINFIRNKFVNSRIEKIAGGNHQLLNESDLILKQVLLLIERYLGKKE